MEKIGKSEFNEKIKNGTVLVDFYADWCGPCKMMHPILEQISMERSEADIYKVNVDEEAELAKEYGIMSIPTLILFKNGVQVGSKVGFIEKETIVEWMNRR